ncbi:MAG: AAA family ATPase [Saprospiraceae bacterium]
MAQKLIIPFKAFKLRFHSGLELVSPLLDKELLHVSTSLNALGGQYAHLLEKEILKQGKLSSLLNEMNEEQFERWSLNVPFNAARDGISFQAFDLEFEYFVEARGTGFWGVLPTLGLEAFDYSKEGLIDQMAEVIRMEFSRKRRLSKVQRIISSIWWDTVQLFENKQEVFAPTPRELEDNSFGDDEMLLTKVAYRLTESEQQVFERKKEMEALIANFQSSFKQNILLVGPSGVGKTAMVKELSFQTEEADTSIWLTTASTLIKEFAGGEIGWESNLTTLCEELAQTDDYLFITNLKELFEVGQYVGNEVSMAEYLIPFLKKGSLKIISECTPEELAKIELRSPMYLSYFTVMKIQTPTKGLEKMIQQKFESKNIAGSNSVKLARTAISEVLRLNQRFSPYSGLPGKPIRFLESILMNYNNTITNKPVVINRKEVIRQFSEESGLPLFIIDPDIRMDVPAIKSKFNSNVYGQERAVDVVVDKLASVKTALTRAGKPISSFLFVGPTGVGKTELAKVLSQFMFGNRNRMVRFDMSEFSGPFAVTRLIGGPDGSDGQLTSAIRQNPFSVLLFDEIEKAHSSVYDLFLQILGDGRLTDQLGKVVNFCSSIIVLTSNIGASNAQGNRISWKPEMETEQIIQFYETAVQKFFRPELYNRIDQVIPFAPLDKDTMRFVVEREMGLLKKLEGIRHKKMNFQIDDSVLDYFAEVGFHPKYGARYLQRTIRDKLTAPLAAALNSFDNEDRLIVNIKMNDGVLSIQTESDPLSMDLYWDSLERLTNADYTSEIRRMLMNMQEGNNYIRLLNQLDIYEEQRKRKKEAFFQDAEQARDYSFLLATKEKVASFETKVFELEKRFDLAILDMIPYETSMENELDSCKDEFFNLKLEIYSRLNPEVNKCTLGIFGENPLLILNFYDSIFQQKKYDVNVQSVWHRDSYFNEEIVVQNSDDNKGTISPRQQYLIQQEGVNFRKKINPPLHSDQLIGFLIKVSGPGVSLFFENEAHLITEWQADEKTTFTYLTQVGGDTLQTPKYIHLKTFFNKMPPMRFIQEGALKDITLGINREVKKWTHAEWVLNGLEEKFKIRVEGLI